MRRYGKHTDEDDIRSRPNRKGNRPRTHIRPKHEDAAEGMVLTVDRGRRSPVIAAQTVTGPAHAPRPTSSTPATIFAPVVARSERSTV